MNVSVGFFILGISMVCFGTALLIYGVYWSGAGIILIGLGNACFGMNS